MKQLTILLIILVTFCSCQSFKEQRIEVYSNDFQTENAANIEGAKFSSYNNTKLLGNYNNSSFSLYIDQLPEHDLVEITFDLYIHDSWDGNASPNRIDGPDKWAMYVDETSYIYTTFSNATCLSGICPPQAYPNNYPNHNNNPKTGAVTKNLPRICGLGYNHITGGTSIYKIKKVIAHQATDLTLLCKDELIQANSANPLCDESWSVDNLNITIIKINK